MNSGFCIAELLRGAAEHDEGCVMNADIADSAHEHFILRFQKSGGDRRIVGFPELLNECSVCHGGLVSDDD
jgi:hypothetical protein